MSIQHNKNLARARKGAGPPPDDVLAAAARHLGDALGQLRPAAGQGPAVYALSVFGVERGAPGASTLAGPALDPTGLSASWPVEARRAAAVAFADPARRAPGHVAVIVIVQAGRVSHCFWVEIPGDAPGGLPPPGGPRRPST